VPREIFPLQASLRIRKPGKIYLGSYPGNKECQKRGGKVFNFQKRRSCKNAANILIFNPAESVPGISFRRMHSHSRSLYIKGTVGWILTLAFSIFKGTVWCILTLALSQYFRGTVGCILTPALSLYFKGTGGCIIHLALSILKGQ
jgi:hypothetical protein